MKRIKIICFVWIGLLLSCHQTMNLEDGLYASFETSSGDLTIELHYKEAPLTVANFVSLAEGDNPNVTDSLKGKKFYDGLPFHRVIPNFMLQGGDIRRNGSGDPGFKFADEFPTNSEGELLFKHNRRGVLSMANSGPNSNGSQFFITHKETPWLDGKHSVFGKVVIGMDLLDSIRQGDLMQRVKILRIGKEAKDFDAVKTFQATLNTMFELEVLKKKKQVKDSILFSKKMKENQALVLPSGLKIIHLNKGNGKRVREGNRIRVHYTGYYAHGAIFDSSLSRDQTFDFVVGVDRVIEGWTLGVQELEEGGSARLFIPYSLAYGAKGFGIIPPKASLVFDIEIIKIED